MDGDDEKQEIFNLVALSAEGCVWCSVWCMHAYHAIAALGQPNEAIVLRTTTIKKKQKIMIEVWSVNNSWQTFFTTIASRSICSTHFNDKFK